MSEAREDRAVPEADAAEQELGVDGSPARLELPGALPDEEPEADVLEQEEVADERRVFLKRQRADDVPEADWLEQSVVEVEDEDEVR